MKPAIAEQIAIKTKSRAEIKSGSQQKKGYWAYASPCGRRGTSDWKDCFGEPPELTRETLTRLRAKRARLHHAVAQEFVLSGKQILHELVAALVRVVRCAREVIVDPHAGGAAEIIRDRKNFIGRFALAK